MAKRLWWQHPKLRKEGDLNIHRKVSWLELFFDLFFVVIISTVSHNLSANISWKGLIDFVLSFLPVWWVWIGATMYNERFETEGLENRIFTFLLMIPVAGMAVFANDCTGHNFVPYVLSYIIARGQITFHWGRGGYHDKQFRPTALYFVSGFSIALLLALVSVFISSYLKFILFGLALALDMLTPTATLKLQDRLPRFSTSKLPERFGLLVIIVLGEVVVGLINGIRSDSSFLVQDFITGILGLLLGFGFWWIYFDFIGRRRFKSQALLVLMWNYLHCFLVLGFIAFGAGIFGTLGNSGNLSASYLFTAAFAFTMFISGVIEAILHRDENEPTHPFISSGLKILSGILAGIVCFFVPVVDVFLLMVILFLLQLIQIIYGIYVWFSQELEGEVTESGF